MAKVKIQGHASGTGILTVTAPNTSTDRTITLPDATGTLLNSDGDGSSLTGVGVDGITSSANATAITIDSSENVGVGVTPSSATGAAKFLHIGSASDAHSALVLQDNTRKWEFQCNDSLSIFAADSEKLKLTSDGRGLSQFTAKCWVNLNGTGTIAINDSHNVSSLIDVGVGQYEVVFSNAMSNANYSATSSNDGWGLGGTYNVSTAKFKCVARDYQWNIADVSVMMAQVFGD